MSEYTPDVWVIVEVNSKEPHHRVLAGWYGGFAGADSWKMNSGISRIVELGDCYEVHGFSGSIYYCGKRSERTNRYTQVIFESFAKDNDDEYSVSIVPMESVLNEYRS